MNSREEIRVRLEAGESFAKIRTETHSTSKLYEVATEFLDDLQERLDNAQAQATQAKHEWTNLEAQADSLHCELKKRREENEELKQENMRLENELSGKKEQLNSLQERIDGFQAKGFTLETMDRLMPMAVRSGEKVLRQVENMQKYDQAIKDSSSLKKLKTRLVRDIRSLKDKKKRTQDSLLSIKHRLDELELQARPLKDALGTVVWLVKKGFTIEDIKSLGYGLDFFGVEGNPDLSISRLVTGLKKQKNLSILEEKISRKTQENAELDRAFENRTTKIQRLQEDAIRNINEVGDASIQSLRQTSAQGQEALTAACQKFDTYVQTSMANFRVQAKEKISWVEYQHRKENELAQQKTLFEKELSYGQFLQAFLGSHEFLSTISMPWILHISHRLQLWISMKLPTETIIPPSSFQGELGIMNFPYRLAKLVELVCLGLEAVSSRQSLPRNGAKTGAG